MEDVSNEHVCRSLISFAHNILWTKTLPSTISNNSNSSLIVIILTHFLNHFINTARDVLRNNLKRIKNADIYSIDIHADHIQHRN